MEYKGYLITNLVLEVIFTKVVFVLWIVSFRAVRQRGDRARRPFAWLKSACPFLAMVCFLAVIGDGVKLTQAELGAAIGSERLYRRIDLWRAESAIIALSELFGRVTHAAVIVCLAELGISLLALAGGRAFSRVLRWAALGLGIAVVVLGLALFGSILDFYVRADGTELEGVSIPGQTTGAEFGGLSIPDRPTLEDLESRWRGVERLGLAARSVTLAASLLILALAAFAANRTYNAKTPQRTVATLFLAASCVYVVNNAWNVALFAVWVVPEKPQGDYIFIVDPILSDVALTAVLILVFAIGRFKQGGLWSLRRRGSAARCRRPSARGVRRGPTIAVEC